MQTLVPFVLIITCSFFVSSAPQNRGKDDRPSSLFAGSLIKRISDDLQGIRSAVRQNQDQHLKRSELLLQNILPKGHRRPGGPRRPGHQEKNSDGALHPAPQETKTKSDDEQSKPSPKDKGSTSPPPDKPADQEEKTEPAPSPQVPEEKKPEKHVAPPPMQPEPQTPPPPPPLPSHIEDWSDVAVRSNQQSENGNGDDGLKRKILSAPCLGGGGVDGSCREAF